VERSKIVGGVDTKKVKRGTGDLASVERIYPRSGPLLGPPSTRKGCFVPGRQGRQERGATLLKAEAKIKSLGHPF